MAENLKQLAGFSELYDKRIYPIKVTKIKIMQPLFDYKGKRTQEWYQVSAAIERKVSYLDPCAFIQDGEST